MKLEIALISIGFACLRGCGIPPILLYGTNNAMYYWSVTMLWSSEKIIHDRIQSFTSSIDNATQHFPFSKLHRIDDILCVTLYTVQKSLRSSSTESTVEVWEHMYVLAVYDWCQFVDQRASRIDQLLRLLGLWRPLSFDNDIRVQIEPTAPKLSRKSVNDVPVQSTPDLPALFRVFGERGHGDFVSEHPEEIFVRQFHQRSLWLRRSFLHTPHFGGVRHEIVVLCITCTQPRTSKALSKSEDSESVLFPRTSLSLNIMKYNMKCTMWSTSNECHWLRLTRLLTLQTESTSSFLLGILCVF